MDSEVSNHCFFSFPFSISDCSIGTEELWGHSSIGSTWRRSGEGTRWDSLGSASYAGTHLLLILQIYRIHIYLETCHYSFSFQCWISCRNNKRKCWTSSLLLEKLGICWIANLLKLSTQKNQRLQTHHQWTANKPQKQTTNSRLWMLRTRANKPGAPVWICCFVFW